MQKLSDVLNTSMGGKLSEYAALSRAWRDSCGDIIFMMTSVVKFSDGVLIIAVHDQNWLSELNFMKGELTERMKQHGLAVTSVTLYYRQRQKSEPTVPVTKKSMSPKEKEYADRLLNTIKDDGLRESFRHALYSYFTVYTLEDYLG